jgi:nucleotide-binding universal stress UspA family protein
MYRTILLAYDGSREGRLALREGALIARIVGAHVVLLAVVDPSDGFFPLVDASGAYMPPEPKVDARKILEEGAERLTRMGLPHQARLETGHPPDRIIAVAEEIAADLVVIGHHPQGMLSRWLMGSVAAALSDGLRCSLLIARQEISDETLFSARPVTAQEER